MYVAVDNKHKLSAEVDISKCTLLVFVANQ